MLSQAKPDWVRAVTAAAAALFILALAYAVYFHLTVDLLPYDDAFITFRYVNNAIAGRGLVFNEGERVMGSSTPLYLAWLAGLKLLAPGSSLAWLAVRLNALWFGLAALASAGLVQQIAGRGPLPWLVGTLVAANLSLLTVSTGGMEAFLFVSLVLGSVWAIGAHRLHLGALLAGLSLLARPEGIFSIGLAALAWCNSDRRRAGAWWGLLLGPALLWAAWATPYYGTPIPHSIIAKSQPMYPLPPGHALLLILQYLADWSAQGALNQTLLLRAALGIGLLVVAAVELARPASWRLGTWQLPALLVTYLLLYAVTNPLLFPWYEPHLYIPWLLILILGIAAIARRLTRNKLLRWLAPGLIVLVLMFRTLTADGRSPSSASSDPYRLRVVSYQQAAEWLNATAPASAVAAVPEIGAFGYYWKGAVLDSCGLISPQALSFMPGPPEERLSPAVCPVNTALVQSFSPDYVVTLQVFIQRSLAVSDWFAAAYHEIHQVPLPSPIWGSDAVLVFERRSDG